MEKRKLKHINLFQTSTGKGKTVKAFWDRRTKIEGGYILERAENIEAFCKAVGKADSIPHFKDYRMHIFENGNTYRISEFIGDLGRFSNTMQLDEECLVKVPGGEEGTFKSKVYVAFL